MISFAFFYPDFPLLVLEVRSWTLSMPAKFSATERLPRPTELSLVSALLTRALPVGDSQSHRQSDGHEGVNSL